ncbi:SAM-dependent methyltransferase [Amycolatopsis samaneae]|uniref:SAM-dependent methyltransferase n=1 Tax=Amycolatopsis samaneae TaxID=664691 RepID=A0ABW5GQ20_9PSEU
MINGFRRKRLSRHREITVPVALGDPDDRLTLWASPGEYPVYDSYDYDYMAEDKVCESAYESALREVAAGRTVLDIGAGRDLDWATLALEYGALEATAVEGMESTARLARKALEKSPYRDRLTLLHSWSTDLETDRRFDLCVSEIIGSIGGSEGAAMALADAHARLLAPGGVMVPHRCVTLAGAVCLRDLVPDLAFHPESLPYLDRIFDSTGHPFDVRLLLSHSTPDAVTTDHAPVETLDFAEGAVIEAEETAELTVHTAGRVDGILLWINLWAHPDDPPIDALATETAWGTTYLPCFDQPVAVRPGDRLTVRFGRTLSDDGRHPDYRVRARLDTVSGTHNGAFLSTHHGEVFRSNPLYEELFSLR